MAPGVVRTKFARAVSIAYLFQNVFAYYNFCYCVAVRIENSKRRCSSNNPDGKVSRIRWDGRCCVVLSFKWCKLYHWGNHCGHRWKFFPTIIPYFRYVMFVSIKVYLVMVEIKSFSFITNSIFGFCLPLIFALMSGCEFLIRSLICPLIYISTNLFLIFFRSYGSLEDENRL